jgi:hypothetical protein
MVGAKLVEITDGRTNCTVRNMMIGTRHQALFGDRIEKGEINNKYGSNGEEKNEF